MFIDALLTTAKRSNRSKTHPQVNGAAKCVTTYDGTLLGLTQGRESCHVLVWVALEDTMLRETTRHKDASTDVAAHVRYLAKSDS